MKKVSIVIDIDEGDLWDIQRFGPRYGLTLDDRVIRAVQNGVPLDQHKKVKKLKQRLNSAYGSLDFVNYKNGDYDCVTCPHDGDSNMCSECENGGSE